MQRATNTNFVGARDSEVGSCGPLPRSTLHNHPYCYSTPSESDIRLTRRLSEGGRILRIETKAFGCDLVIPCWRRGISQTSWKNTGTAENRYLLVFSPAGFENFIDATAVAAPDDAAAPTEPPAVAVQNVMELAASYGIHFG